MRRTLYPTIVGVLLVLGGLGSIASGCGASGDGLASDCSHNACGGGGSAGSKADDASASPLPVEGSVPDAGPTRNALCGTTGCFPGNISACGAAPTGDAAYTYPASEAGDAPSDAGAALSDGGDAADRGPALSNRDGSVDDVAEADASSGPRVIDEPEVPKACYVKPGPTGVIAECTPSGHRGDGETCADSSDCGAGLACVDLDAKAQCRPFSCGLAPITCPTGTSYQEAPLRVVGATRDDVKVPVCVPNDHCALLAPQNPCPDGEVCAAAGNEGDTTCIVPGVGKQGETCDEARRCAEGMLCSKHNNECVKLCHIGADNECPVTCQGGNNAIPKGFGICVGEARDGG